MQEFDLTLHPSIRGACIEKESADALLFRSSTLTLVLVEEGLGSRAGQPESLDSSVDSKAGQLWSPDPDPLFHHSQCQN